MIEYLQEKIIPHYVEPIAKQPIVRTVLKVLAEVIKIVVAKVFLEFLGRSFLIHAATSDLKAHKRFVYNTTVFAPVVEELIFRGGVLKGIHLIQKIWNRFKGRELTQDEAKWQEVFRVQVSAIIFAAAHLFNPHKNSASALVQFTWSYLGGVTYGYLTEKYDTLAVSMVAHGINNSLSVAGSIVYPAHVSMFLMAIFAHKYAAYVLATTDIDKKIYSGMCQTAQFCVDLPGRCSRWYEGDRQVAASAA